MIDKHFQLVNKILKTIFPDWFYGFEFPLHQESQWYTPGGRVPRKHQKTIWECARTERKDNHGGDLLTNAELTPALDANMTAVLQVGSWGWIGPSAYANIRYSRQQNPYNVLYFQKDI